MTLGDKIYELRKRTGLSQEDLADKFNVTRQTVSLWETNKSLPTLDNLKELAKFFGVTLDELCGDGELSADDKPDSGNNTAPTTAELNQKQDVLCRATTVCDRELYKLMMNRTTKNARIVYFIAFVFFAVATAVNVALLPFNSQAIAFAIISGVFLLLYIIMKLLTKNAINSGLAVDGELELSYTFYAKKMELTTKSANGISNYSEAYTAFKISCDDTAIYFRFHNRIAALKWCDLGENKELVEKLLGVTKTPEGVKRSVKISLLVLFIASFIAPFVAIFFAAVISDMVQAVSFLDYMWTFFVFAAVPIASIILGVLNRKKEYRYMRNIIFGAIVAAIMVIIGIACLFVSV